MFKEKERPNCNECTVTTAQKPGATTPRKRFAVQASAEPCDKYRFDAAWGTLPWDDDMQVWMVVREGTSLGDARRALEFISKRCFPVDSDKVVEEFCSCCGRRNVTPDCDISF